MIFVALGAFVPDLLPKTCLVHNAVEHAALAAPIGSNQRDDLSWSVAKVNRQVLESFVPIFELDFFDFHVSICENVSKATSLSEQKPEFLLTNGIEIGFDLSNLKASNQR